MELLTIKAISQQIGIPQSTLRYYRDLYSQYLPHTGEGKRKRFYKEAIDVFQAISNGMKNNKPSTEIEHELNNKFPQFIDINKEEFNKNKFRNSKDARTVNYAKSILSHLNSKMPTENRMLMHILNEHKKQAEQVEDTINAISKQQAEIENLKQEVSKLEEIMEKELTKHFQLIDSKLSQTTEQEITPKPFWKRIFAPFF
ncbi:MerR family transcriptional regulator [Selenomonadales bacterium OttesenSCG-928-I06]|nr:MerR family transcriptional regulator [Selenomonadales bacterium OttesenSCG-928-I06]